MSKLFRVYFIHGVHTDILPQEYEDLVTKLAAGMAGTFITYSPVTKAGVPLRRILLNVNHITHIVEVLPKTEGSAVVTPPRPETVKREADRAQAIISTDIGEVLEDVKEELR